MKDRRTLTEGLKATPPPLDPDVVKRFVHGEKAESVAQAPVAQVPPSTTPRSPLSTRLRADYAKALKRASLDRQLKGVEPSAVCDILEQALEPWLKANGYLS
jgi:hypothetical protein